MSKIIIDNRSDLDMRGCLELVDKVIRCGRISNDATQYCYATAFDGAKNNWIVYTDLNKKSDRFIIMNQKK